MADRPKLYVTPGSGNSFKVVLLAHQVERSCELSFVDVVSGENRQRAFLDINPGGQLPYLVLPDGSGLGESNAIAWYLAEDTPLLPKSPRTRAQALQWMIFEQTSLMPYISPARFFTSIAPQRGAAHALDIPVWIDKGTAGLSVLNAYLGDREFITDDGYTVADVAVFGYTHLAEEGGFSLGNFPAIRSWIRRVQAQPRYLPIAQLLSPSQAG